MGEEQESKGVVPADKCETPSRISFSDKELSASALSSEGSGNMATVLTFI
jgi:hypothetical protein